MALKIPYSVDPTNSLGLPSYTDFLRLNYAALASYLVDVDFSDPGCYTKTPGGNLTSVQSKAPGGATVTLTGTIAHGATIASATAATLVDNQYITIGPPLSPKPSWTVALLAELSPTQPEAASAMVTDGSNANFGIFGIAKTGGWAYIPNCPPDSPNARSSGAVVTPGGPVLLVATVTTGLAVLRANGREVYRSTNPTEKTTTNGIRIGGQLDLYSAVGKYSRLIVFSEALSQSSALRLERTLADEAGFVFP